MIFFDTETALIGPGRLAPPLTCVQYAVDGCPVGVVVEGVDPVVEFAREMLGGFVVGHNVAYDMLVLGREHPELLPLIFLAYNENRVSDTQVREKLKHIAAGTLRAGLSLSLAALAQKYGGEKNANDPWRLRYAELRGVPFAAWPDDAKVYATHDVEATRLVYEEQGPGLVSPDEYRQVRAAFALHIVGAAGVHTDPVAVEAYVKKVQKELGAEEALLRREGLVREDGSKDTKLAMARMLSVVGEEAKLTPSGGVCLDEDSCQESGDEALIAYQRYGSRRTLLSRLDSLRQPLINPQFDSLIATGRTSCRKDSSLVASYQLQNMRREEGERECFVPEKGSVFVACDFDGFEMCAFAQVCIDLTKHSVLAQRLNEGLDTHLYMASKILGIPYEEALRRKVSGDQEVREMRQLSKAANFGFPGGLGAAGFCRFARGYGVDIDLHRAQELREDWLSTWPETAVYFDTLQKKVWSDVRTKKGVREVTTITQLRSGRVRGRVPYTVAANSFFQGLAADAAKDALYAVVMECEIGSLRGWKAWNFVHDEIILEGPMDDGDRAARELQRIMVERAQAWMPDVEIKASPTMMLRWAKAAKPVYVAGRLVPWTSSR